MSQTATVRIHSRKFCVYAHRANGAIFYIGKGRGGRPFSSTGRTAKWKDYERSFKCFDVEIIAWFDRDEDARTVERKLVRKFKPSANTVQLFSDFDSDVGFSVSPPVELDNEPLEDPWKTPNGTRHSKFDEDHWQKWLTKHGQLSVPE